MYSWFQHEKISWERRVFLNFQNKNKTKNQVRSSKKGCSKKSRNERLKLESTRMSKAKHTKKKISLYPNHNAYLQIKAT